MKQNKNFGGIIAGKGYYIALILCAVAIGITGYLYYRHGGSDPQHELQAEPVAQTHPGDVEAAATEPGLLPTEPEAPREQILKTVFPVEGEAAAGYAMDCLSYNETTRDWRVHDGIDLTAAAGTGVQAAADGQVYTVYEDETMGTTVVIRHSGGYTTCYASLAPEVQVAAGDTVQVGQTIGCVGTTALLENALGDHVHFSVSRNDQVMDPMEFLRLGE